MTTREKMKELIGITDLDDFDKAYAAIVGQFDPEALHALMPATDEEITAALAEDENLNNIPIVKWDAAAGFRVWVNRRLQTQEVAMIPGARLHKMLSDIGVDSFSCSECVCILKTYARMRFGA